MCDVHVIWFGFFFCMLIYVCVCVSVFIMNIRNAEDASQTALFLTLPQLTTDSCSNKEYTQISAGLLVTSLMKSYHGSVGQ